MFKLYVEDLKDAKIACGDGGELVWLLLEFSAPSTALFMQYKVFIFFLNKFG